MSEDSNDVAVEDVRAIAVALGLGGHARPYSAHEVVLREILPALAPLLAAQAAVERVKTLATELEYEANGCAGPSYRAAQRLQAALDGAP